MLQRLWHISMTCIAVQESKEQEGAFQGIRVLKAKAVGIHQQGMSSMQPCEASLSAKLPIALQGHH